MTDNHDSQPPKIVWGPELRNWVSLLIFLHLFAVFVAVTAYTRPSGMQEQLHRVFGMYLRNLHMTAFPVTYPFARYHLTHASPTDVDFTCEVEVTDDSGAKQTTVIPVDGLFPRVRYRRYQALANATGSLAANEENDEFNSILPKAIAGGILKRHGATQGLFRCRAHYLPEPETMGTYNPEQRGDLDRVVYEAQVFLSPTGVELLKKSSTLEVSPVGGGAPGAKVPAPATKVPAPPAGPSPIIP